MGASHDYPRSEYRTLRQRARTALSASPTLLIPIVIVGSILGGFANPTEAAAVGAVAAALWALCHQRIQLWQHAAHPAALGHVFGHRVVSGGGRRRVLVAADLRQVPQAVAAWIQTVAHDPVTFCC